MFSFKPKPISGQVLAAVCLLFVLALFESAFTKSGGKSDLVHPVLVGNLSNSGMEKNSLASIKIDTASQYIGQVVDIPILIRNDVVLGGFELQVDFPKENLSLLQVQRGEALSDTTNGEYDWEYFVYNVSIYTDTFDRCNIYGAYDLTGDPHQGVPLAPQPGYVSLVMLKFAIAPGNFPSGTLLPIIFEWEGTVVNDSLIEDWDCVENILWNSSFDTLYASQNPVQFNPVLCPAGGGTTLSPYLEFSDGGVYALYDSGMTGDINLNGITYEVADGVLFQNFLLYGDSILIDPEQQTDNSDVNCDHLPWSIADLLYMCRVILHEAVEIPCEAQGSALSEYIAHPQDNTDQFTIVSSSAHPGQVVSVPVWLSNSTVAGGTTFKVVFDSSDLSVEGVDASQTRIEGWENITPVIKPGELFFFAFPDWWNHLFPYIQLGEGTLIKVNFRINANVPPGTFLPITFQTEPNLGHYNAYTDTTGLIFIQPSTVSRWIFTDVIIGDVNSDGIVDVTDLVYLIDYLYMDDKPPSPVSLGDLTQDDEVNLGDVVALINFIYRS
jgi:hypothetical protein